MTEVAIIGNPNSGKSTAFNALTGASQRVGNWPGVTVEKKSGFLTLGDQTFEIVDLPGLYNLEGELHGEDEQLVQAYFRQTPPDCIVNVVDASTLARSLLLTTQLLETQLPLIVVLNKIDVATSQHIHIDIDAFSKRLGCPVIPLVAKRRVGMKELHTALLTTHQRAADQNQTNAVIGKVSETIEERFDYIDAIVAATVEESNQESKITRAIDHAVLNKYLALPIFLAVMYLMFLFTINVGSAFIDFFSTAGNALFVDGPRVIYESIGFPAWLTALLADGVGGGIQLVATFVPVIACLFLFLSVLEDTGYMGRIAFVLDRLMQQLGLPGKSFVPLLVGFGCNVPAVMATRTLDNKPDRILTTIMVPFMSCGARLTVYTLFAAAFFQTNGQNIVFALYVIGIAIAVLSAWIVRRHLLPETRSTFSLELPLYHLPTLRGVLTVTWHRVGGFIKRAGKAIVLVVVALNVLNSVGSDGSFGNTNSENSALSAIGKAITPVFHPMGIDKENWPATVGIFTGIFAKEVVVGTLDALYSPATSDTSTFDFGDEIFSAFQSIPANLSALSDAILDPLGLNISDVTMDEVTEEQNVQINTLTAMQSLFHGKLGAFSYLLFILLYMPCVATIGVVYKEIGSFWAAFSTVWSIVCAYSVAVICYQLGTFMADPVSSALWLALVVSVCGACFVGLIAWGKSRPAIQQQILIPLKNLD